MNCCIYDTLKAQTLTCLMILHLQTANDVHVLCLTLFFSIAYIYDLSFATLCTINVIRSFV
jgi:hypothetical protein